MPVGLEAENSLSNKWRRRIQEWTASGQAGTDWCRENNLSYNQFWYWKERLKGKKRKSRSTKGRFVEIQDKAPSKARIVIEFQGIQISIIGGFDEESLLRCIRLLRKL